MSYAYVEFVVKFFFPRVARLDSHHYCVFL